MDYLCAVKKEGKHLKNFLTKADIDDKIVRR